MPKKLQLLLSLLALLAGGVRSTIAVGMDRIIVNRDGEQVRLEGQVLLTAGDGGVLLKTQDGQLWPILADQLVERSETPAPFEMYSSDMMAEQLLAELPAGFATHSTANYLICYNTSKAYASWCGSLFERLYAASSNFWSRRGFELHSPSGPLVVIVFAERSAYEKFAKRDLGDAAGSIVGYYNLQSNRVNMYDLTGSEALRGPASKRGSLREISAMLSTPNAAPMVATVVHEATHQIAFNSGVQTRYTDVPLWVSEGIAIYFETPDLKSSRGWRGIGAINRPRLTTFKRNVRRRGTGALASLISSDTQMRNVETAADAYAEAWALTYFLIQQHRDEYLAYLKMLAKKNRMVWDSPEDRLREFQAFFGDIKELEADFVQSMTKLR